MYSVLNQLNPVCLALLGGFFTFFITSLGSSIVFFFKSCNKRIMNGMVSISAGIMIAASFFSLINPAIEIGEKNSQNFITTVVLGFIIGSIFVLVGNMYFEKIKKIKENGLKRCILLFSSITLHNIPEGLAIGVAFGNILYGNSVISAIILTIGIAIQNFPEGSAVSLPLKREGISSSKAFLFGSLSGIVEPIASVIGALLVLRINSILSFILSFAAGAMIFVTVLELIPESQNDEKKDLMALLFIFGFVIMMILDILLG